MTLGDIFIGVASATAICAGIGAGYGFIHSMNELNKIKMQEREKISQVFRQVGVPAGQEPLVREVLFNQSGDCTRLSPDLQTPCQNAREGLHIQYGERPVLSIDRQ